MSSHRVRRAVPSALNSPTAVRVNKIQNITGSEAERLITEFINASEANASGVESDNRTGLSKNSDSSAILSQLKRIQRNLRGLPPIISETTSQSTGTTSEPANKKIKFDEEEEEEEQKPVEYINVNSDSESKSDNEKTVDEQNIEEQEGAEKSKKKDKKDKKHKKEKKEKSKD